MPLIINMAKESIVYISQDDKSRVSVPTNHYGTFLREKYKKGIYCNSISELRSNLILVDGIYLDLETQTVYQKCTIKLKENNEETIRIKITKLGNFEKITPLTEIIRKDLEMNPMHIEFIVDQTEEMCWTVIKKDAGTFKYIRKPSQEMCIHVLTRHPTLIEYIENPSAELCSIVISQGYFKCIKNPTREIYMVAIKEIRYEELYDLYKDIERRNMIDDDILKAFLYRDNSFYRYIKDFSPEIQKYIIDLNYENYFSIKDLCNQETKDYAISKYMAAMQNKTSNS